MTGLLGLGEFDAHPYQRLVQTPVVDALDALIPTIERVLDEVERRPDELRASMDDYARRLRAEAVDRYVEFLGP